MWLLSPWSTAYCAPLNMTPSSKTDFNVNSSSLLTAALLLGGGQLKPKHSKSLLLFVALRLSQGYSMDAIAAPMMRAIYGD